VPPWGSKRLHSGRTPHGAALFADPLFVASVMVLVVAASNRTRASVCAAARTA